MISLNRIRVVRWCTLFVAVFLIVRVLPHATAEQLKPNVVLILSDDQGYMDYGFMGHEVIQTPHLDKLASESLVYTRGYVPTALCSPSIATILTGKYPHEHGMTGNDPVRKREREKWYASFEKQTQLPKLLADAGYQSFQTGKYWLGHYSRSGFTDGMTVKGRHGEAGLGIGRKTMQPVFDFIDKSQDAKEPFFLWYAPFMPHQPHTPPTRILNKYKNAGEQAKYFAMCDWFDETCGELLSHLETRGLKDNTIIIYICDNGWPETAKGSPYDSGIRTPIMIRWPSHVKPRMEREQLASSIDLLPTLLIACGLKPDSKLSGINLLDSKSVSRRNAIFGENYCHDMIDLEHPEASLRARSCIQGDWKLTLWQNPLPTVRTYNPLKPEGDVELYNLKADSEERGNLAEKQPEKVKELKALIDDWWALDGASE